MLVLRDSIKQWEREFERKNGVKPSPRDIKADAAVREMYRKYRDVKAGKIVSTPQKPKLSSTSVPDLKPVESVAPQEVTPEKPTVTEVFPTPQLQGRALGLFDVQLNPVPVTPQGKMRAPMDRMSPIRTPADQIHGVDETPQSKRTPQYLLQQTTLFGSPSESPLVPSRSARSTRSVSQIIQEMEEMSDIDSDIEQQVLAEADQAASNEAPPPEDSDKTNSAPQPNKSKWNRRKGPKRTTKKVVMRPVADTDKLSNSRVTDNYKRMTIHKKGNQKFKRR